MQYIGLRIGVMERDYKKKLHQTTLAETKSSDILSKPLHAEGGRRLLTSGLKGMEQGLTI